MEFDFTKRINHIGLSPLDVATKHQILRHLATLRRGSLLKFLMPLLQRYLHHSANRGVFNQPVDPIAMDLPDYCSVVANPMDLGTVKQKLQSLLYEDEIIFSAEVMLVFQNSIDYNKEGHFAHEAAKQLLAEFQVDYAKLLVRKQRKVQQIQSHACFMCRGNQCVLCNEKCLKLDPSVIPCSGSCGKNMRAGGIFYSAKDNMRHWCQRCYNGLPAQIPPPLATKGQGAGCILEKKLLVKHTKSLTEIGEAWVQCDWCQQWMHQVSLPVVCCVSPSTIAAIPLPQAASPQAALTFHPFVLCVPRCAPCSTFAPICLCLTQLQPSTCVLFAAWPS